MEPEIKTYAFNAGSETLTINEFFFKNETKKWVIIHDGLNVYLPGILNPNDKIQTIFPYVEIFNSEEEARAAFPQVVWP